MDEMVELNKSEEWQLRSFEGVRQVTIRGVDDIYKVLTEEQRATKLSPRESQHQPCDNL